MAISHFSRNLVKLLKSELKLLHLSKTMQPQLLNQRQSHSEVNIERTSADGDTRRSGT